MCAAKYRGKVAPSKVTTSVRRTCNFYRFSFSRARRPPIVAARSDSPRLPRLRAIQGMAELLTASLTPPP
eukprot:1396894-Pyramimonas_sp.AAC.1